MTVQVDKQLEWSQLYCEHVHMYIRRDICERNVVESVMSISQSILSTVDQ